MTNFELREWWAEYQVARTTHQPVGELWRAEKRFTDALDYTDRRQLCGALRER
jgi:hypothetical protein